MPSAHLSDQPLRDGAARPGTGPGAGRIRAPQDLTAGLLMMGIGLAALWIGRDWNTGTLAYVQSGFFPRLISGLLVLFGLVTAGRGLLLHGASLSNWAWRPLAGVTVAVLAFAAMLETLGLVPAVLLLVGLGNLAGQPLRAGPLAVLGGALALGSVAIFVWGLGLPMKVWP
ncbi:tripartite tricarboxylate transporter TctB family protein [Azospirillum soli]|uniref:tripartite tricarboxylate transporter TctB family protein n=1 Tax=Azospirillum soli TaxID=1304799 RepID=UPI001AE10DA6|nr:tripartite tricarboxylate transporter TctB family protein [Azospirillum soli]MBP2316073.1 hypothetical protein [Azospirillum soli]